MFAEPIWWRRCRQTMMQERCRPQAESLSERRRRIICQARLMVHVCQARLVAHICQARLMARVQADHAARARGAHLLVPCAGRGRESQKGSICSPAWPAPNAGLAARVCSPCKGLSSPRDSCCLSGPHVRHVLMCVRMYACLRVLVHACAGTCANADAHARGCAHTELQHLGSLRGSSCGCSGCTA